MFREAWFDRPKARSLFWQFEVSALFYLFKVDQRVDFCISRKPIVIKILPSNVINLIVSDMKQSAWGRLARKELY